MSRGDRIYSWLDWELTSFTYVCECTEWITCRIYIYPIGVKEIILACVNFWRCQLRSSRCVLFLYSYILFILTRRNVLFYWTHFWILSCSRISIWNIVRNLNIKMWNTNKNDCLYLAYFVPCKYVFMNFLPSSKRAAQAYVSMKTIFAEILKF